MANIILASASPRRRELLQKHNLSFTVMPLDVDENVDEKVTPAEYVVEVSGRKAAAAAEKEYPPGTVILAADTAVALDGQIFGKPADLKAAERMLRLLSGRTHEVYTGIALIFFKEDGKKEIHDFEVTQVKFKELSDKDIEEYIKTKEPLGKAGAYAIQGEGAKLVEWISGDYENVVGLPVKKVLDAISLYG